jgi:anti-sigma B factor antagonist
MPSEPRRHLDVTVVKDVAVVGFATPEAVFQTKEVQELDDELVRLFSEEGHTKVLLNLTGIRYLSSSMLVRLINLQKRVVQSQGQLVLCCLTPVMLDTFRVSKLDQLFKIYPDQATALESF